MRKSRQRFVLAAGMSDEHIVSEAVLRFLQANIRGNPQVYAQNTARVPRGVRRLRDIGRMTAPILCTTHNRRLAQCIPRPIRQG